MPIDKPTVKKEDEKKKALIVEGWATIFKKYCAGELNEQEKAQFDRAKFSDEQARKNSFVLGRQINRNF